MISPHTPFDYELFNRNNSYIRPWSWNYRGCWHQTCPPVISCNSLTCTQRIEKSLLTPLMPRLVTTSPSRNWVICAPAAFLGCGSRFSGSLSGIEPRFSVTRRHHGRPRSYRPQLIGQKSCRCIDLAVDSPNIMIRHGTHEAAGHFSYSQRTHARLVHTY